MADSVKIPKSVKDYLFDELSCALKDLEKWHKNGEKIVNLFLGTRGGMASGFSLNLFHSNIKTVQSMLCGSIPRVDVSRRYADPNDDVSRVAAEIMERLLNNDISDREGHYQSVLESTLQDRLLPGLGVARIRYEFTEEQSTALVMDPETGEYVEVTESIVTGEDAPVDYIFWRDVAWGWARNWGEVPWVGFRSYLSKEEVRSRFGNHAADNIPFKKRKTDDQSNDDSAPEKAGIWEIWHKDTRRVYYMTLGYDRILDAKDDPLQLSGFYPCPPFFLANPTTSKFFPTPDYELAKDLYEEIDNLQTRIAVITQAIKVVGLYDSSSPSIPRLFAEGVDNTLLPVENWALFGEKGGLRGVVDWFPLDEVTSALDRLVQKRDETIDLLYQVTGMADILRGASQGQYEGVGTSRLKAKFGSVRVQALQDKFAAFASSIMELKAEVICRHFDPQTMIKYSGIDNSFDLDIVPQAIQLLSDPDTARLRVKIRPESVAMVDYTELKEERTEYINALALFLQSAAPIMEQDPRTKPFLFQMLQWGLAGFKGASEIEGVLDRAIEQASQEQEEQQGQPDPALQLEQFKAQAEIQKIQAKAQADLMVKTESAKQEAEIAMQNHAARIAETQSDLMAKVAGINAKMEADIATELVRIQGNIRQSEVAGDVEIRRSIVNAELDVATEGEKSAMKMREIVASTISDIEKTRVAASKKADTGGNKDGEPEMS